MTSSNSVDTRFLPSDAIPTVRLLRRIESGRKRSLYTFECSRNAVKCRGQYPARFFPAINSSCKWPCSAGKSQSRPSKAAACAGKEKCEPTGPAGWKAGLEGWAGRAGRLPALESFFGLPPTGRALRLCKLVVVRRYDERWGGGPPERAEACSFQPCGGKTGTAGRE